MFSEFERNCLLNMAQACKHRGLSPKQAERHIQADIGAFCESFRIHRAVRAVFVSPS